MTNYNEQFILTIERFEVKKKKKVKPFIDDILWRYSKMSEISRMHIYLPQFLSHELTIS